MKKNDKIFIIVFIGIVSFALMYLFQASYAKYRRLATSQIDARIASWNILVNNESIANKTELTNSITPVIDANQYVKSGVIAPGTTGHFDIVIDAYRVQWMLIHHYLTFVLQDMKSMERHITLEQLVKL